MSFNCLQPRKRIRSAAPAARRRRDYHETRTARAKWRRSSRREQVADVRLNERHVGESALRGPARFDHAAWIRSNDLAVGDEPGKRHGYFNARYELVAFGPRPKPPVRRTPAVEKADRPPRSRPSSRRSWTKPTEFSSSGAAGRTGTGRSPAPSSLLGPGKDRYRPRPSLRRWNARRLTAPTAPRWASKRWSIITSSAARRS